MMLGLCSWRKSDTIRSCLQRLLKIERLVSYYLGTSLWKKRKNVDKKLLMHSTACNDQICIN